MDRRIFRHQFLLPLAVSVVVILLVFSGCAPAPGKVTAPKAPTSPLIAGVAMQISDIHFNPLYDETIFKKLQAAEPEAWEDIFAISSKKGVGAYHNFPEETYYPLLLSAFKNMAAVSKKPDFILFTGDFLAHTFPKRYKTANGGSQGFHSFVDKTLAFCAFMFNKYMPGVPVYFTLGNNDTYSGDYRIVPEGEFLKKTAQIFSQSLFRNPANRELFSKTFPIGGYYSIVPPTGAGTRIISLNSNFFSTHYETSFTRYNPGDRELDWLEAQLKSARENKEKVWILQHIPNGPSIYSYVTKKTYDPQWSAKYNSRYIELLTAYSDIVNAGFAGHTHMDSYRLLMGGQPALPLSFINISPAVSALFGNNPGFKRITYRPVGFSLVDYTVFYLDLQTVSPTSQGGKWKKEYNFRESYGQPILTRETLLNVHSAIKNDPTKRELFRFHYDVNHGITVTESNWKAYWCGITGWTKTGFESCTAK